MFRSPIALLLAAGCSQASARKPVERPTPPPIQSFAATSLKASFGAGSTAAAGTKDNQALEFWSSSSASGPLELLYPASGLIVRAKGESCKGAPQMIVLVDGAVLLSADVSQTNWADFPIKHALTAGKHEFQIVFPNDLWEPSRCDRNLLVDRVTLMPSLAGSHNELRGEELNVTWGASPVADPTASSGLALELSSSTSGVSVVTLDRPQGAVVVRAKGDQCDGPPHMELAIDGVQVMSADVDKSSWTDVWAKVPLTAGDHTVSVAFTNDLYMPPRCDRNLYVDRIAFAGAVPQGHTPSVAR